MACLKLIVRFDVFGYVSGAASKPEPHAVPLHKIAVKGGDDGKVHPDDVEAAEPKKKSKLGRTMTRAWN